MTAER